MLRRGQRHDHWSFSASGWWIGPVGLHDGRRIFMVRAPNHRRWVSWTLKRNRLATFASAVHRLGRCGMSEAFDLPLPDGLVPKGLREVPLRRCIRCEILRHAEDEFAGPTAKYCRGCVAERCMGRSEVVDCPSCHEPTSNDRLTMVLGKGWACETCARVAVARPEQAATLVAPAPQASRSAVVERLVAEAAAGFDRFDQAREAIAAAFGV